MIIRITLFSLSVLLFSCSTGDTEEKNNAREQEKEKGDTTSIHSERNEASKTEKVMFQFICRDIGEGMDNPFFEVSLRMGSDYYILDTIHTCGSIPLRSFEEYEIPERALAACGGWYQAEGEYFYVIEEAAKIKVMYAWQTEEQSTQGYFYKMKRELPLPAMENIFP